MMSFSSYIGCGLHSASMDSDEDSESSSQFSIMDFFQDFPLCCQDTEAVEAIFRPYNQNEDSGREVITHGNRIMEKPWRPPRYRDTSLQVDPRDTEDDSKPSASSPKTITPSVGVISCDDSIPSQKHDSSPRSTISNGKDISLPADFIPPKNPISGPKSFEFEAFSRQDQNSLPDRSVDEDSISLSYSKSQSSTSSTANISLGPEDVVCGRGAPTSIHLGNLAFKKTIKKHEMTYLCSTRSEKPKVAMKLLDEFRARGVRFIKRERNEDGSFVWVDIGKQRSYEKICQSLREGAPQLRRQMMATEAKRRKTANDETNVRPRSGNRRHLQRQQRQDSDTKFAGETTRIVCDVSRAHTSSSFSTVKTSNVYPYNPVGEEKRNVEWLYRHDYDRRDRVYDIGRHYDVPYYFHLPPHLGGERLFEDRIE